MALLVLDRVWLESAALNIARSGMLVSIPSRSGMGRERPVTSTAGVCLGPVCLSQHFLSE